MLFGEASSLGYLSAMLDEIILQSKVEFNYEDDEETSLDEVVEAF